MKNDASKVTCPECLRMQARINTLQPQVLAQRGTIRGNAPDTPMMAQFAEEAKSRPSYRSACEELKDVNLSPDTHVLATESEVE